MDSHEKQVIEDLLADFAFNRTITPEEVYKISWERFNTLEGNFDLIRTINANLTILATADKQRKYFQLPLILHGLMFRELFTFAGKYRRFQDPGNGLIFFGKTKANKRSPEFEGSKPDDIENGVYESIELLLEYERHDPIKAVTFFYQKFIKVHPFYDGNGRIARLISNIFLAGHGRFIIWSEFDSKSKFLKKLNRCHKSLNPESFENLASFLKSYTHNVEDFE